MRNHFLKRNVRLVKDGSHRHGEGAPAFMALPTAHRAVLACMDACFLALAVVARRLSIPSDALQILHSVKLGLELLKNFYNVHYEEYTRGFTVAKSTPF